LQKGVLESARWPCLQFDWMHSAQQCFQSRVRGCVHVTSGPCLCFITTHSVVTTILPYLQVGEGCAH
jgi:hypothetical protein